MRGFCNPSGIVQRQYTGIPGTPGPFFSGLVSRKSLKSEISDRWCIIDYNPERFTPLVEYVWYDERL